MENLAREAIAIKAGTRKQLATFRPRHLHASTLSIRSVKEGYLRKLELDTEQRVVVDNVRCVVIHRGCICAIQFNGRMHASAPTSERLRELWSGGPAVPPVLCIASYGDWLITGHANGEIRSWSVEARQFRAVALQRACKVTALSVGGGWLLSGYEDGTVERWRLVRGSDSGSLEWGGALLGAAGEIRPLAAGEGWAAACGSGVCAITVWDTETATAEAVLAGHTDRVTALAAAGAQAGGGWSARRRTAPCGSGAPPPWTATTGGGGSGGAHGPCRRPTRAGRSLHAWA